MLNVVTFVGWRYGLTTVRLQGMTMDFQRTADNRWFPPASVTIGAGPWRFDLTDINGRVISTNPLIENGQVEQSTGVQTPPCQ